MRKLNDLIPDPSMLEIGDVDYASLGDLSKIELISFTAEPERIGPFSSSVISWSVQDNDSGCSVVLNGVRVATSGSLRVTPSTTHPYILKANNGANSLELGRLDVQVDLDSCTVDEFAYLDQALTTFLELYVSEFTGLRPRGQRGTAIHVQTSLENIRFSMELEYVVDNLPNPCVSIHGDLGLDVMDDGPILNRKKLYGYFKNLRIEADYSTWQWAKASALGPFSAIAAAQAIETAERAAADNINDLFDHVIGLPLIAGVPPTGKGIHNVSLSAGADGLGAIRRTFCPMIGPAGLSGPRITPRKRRN